MNSRDSRHRPEFPHSQTIATDAPDGSQIGARICTSVCRVCEWCMDPCSQEAARHALSEDSLDILYNPCQNRDIRATGYGSCDRRGVFRATRCLFPIPVRRYQLSIRGL